MDPVENCLLLALEANPDDWSVRLLLAEKMVERDASAEASDLIFAAPNPPQSENDLERMVELVGEAAIPQLEAVIAKRPNHLFTHQLLAHLLVLKGEEDRAQNHFEVAQGLGLLKAQDKESFEDLPKEPAQPQEPRAEDSPAPGSASRTQDSARPAGSSNRLPEQGVDPPPLSSPNHFASLPKPKIGSVETAPAPGKKGAKVTSVLVALAVHVILALLAALLVILPPARDNPEIVASITKPKPKNQEMQKKNVAKRVKKSSPASAAAAPLAQLIRANAVAKISLPEVTRTSTGPLGIGESNLGSGRFGNAGLGNGEAMFMGSSVRGRMAVVFDISGSMYEANPVVIKEINKRFRSAQVVAVFGARFNRSNSSTRFLPYQKNKEVLDSVEWNGRGKTATRDAMNKALFSLRECDSLPGGKKGTNGLIPTQSLGTAIELLLKQPRSTRPSAIFTFSDFQDGCDPAYLEEVCKLAWQNGVKLVFYHPVKFQRDKDKYLAAIKKTRVDGEVKEGL